MLSPEKEVENLRDVYFSPWYTVIKYYDAKWTILTYMM